ncbi:sortase [Agaribacter marinus]|uniref:Class D sortase n=1 Tax=Virgibacillus salarius TaxID=447199 RepID=A0A941DSM4_9BACI|nr:class D sortase [Virgibacillus salarius]MBR7794429.1 class D sortase [Virgibacillus salarius]NAZ07153.1 sortase [Agaribacter marinus]
MNRNKIIGGAFIFIGLILVAIPLYYEWNQQKEVNALEDALSLIAQSDDESVDLSTIDDLPFTQEELKQVIELEIPSIDLKQKVLPETTEANLSIALTQIKPNQTPGEGNFTIAGHRGYRSDRHFRQLPEVSIGDKAILHTATKKYVYEITSSEVIEATKVEILEDKDNKREITLITCTIDGKERIALKGRLIDREV